MELFGSAAREELTSGSHYDSVPTVLKDADHLTITSSKDIPPAASKSGYTLERLQYAASRCSDPGESTDYDVKGMKTEEVGGCSCMDFPAS